MHNDRADAHSSTSWQTPKSTLVLVDKESQV